MKIRNQIRAEQMRSHLEACSKSELTVSQYCLENGLIKSCYYYWHKKLSYENKDGGFIPVCFERSPAASSVEIIYPNGVRLSFSVEISVPALKESGCCI